MSNVWQLQEAKNKFSEVVEAALNAGPQIVTRRGVETVIVLSYTEYRKILLNQPKLSEFFRKSSLAEGEIELTCDRIGFRPEELFLNYNLPFLLEFRIFVGQCFALAPGRAADR